MQLSSFGGLAGATMDAENVHIENASGYSLIPGCLNVHGLRVRVKDHNAQTEVLADSAEMSVVLWQLPYMMLHPAVDPHPWRRAPTRVSGGRSGRQRVHASRTPDV